MTVSMLNSKLEIAEVVICLYYACYLLREFEVLQYSIRATCVCGFRLPSWDRYTADNIKIRRLCDSQTDQPIVFQYSSTNTTIKQHVGDALDSRLHNSYVFYTHLELNHIYDCRANIPTTSNPHLHHLSSHNQTWKILKELCKMASNESLQCTASNTINLTNEMQASRWLTSPRAVAIVTIALPTVGCAGILANLAALFVFSRIRRMHTITNLYLANWAIADILFLLSTVNLLMSVFLSSPVTKNIPATSSLGCWGFYGIAHVSGAVSTYMATLVAYERYSSITSPLQHHVRNTRRRAGKIVVFMWIVAMPVSALYMMRYAHLAEWCIVWPANRTYDGLPIVFRKCVPIDTMFFTISESFMGILFYVILVINVYFYCKIIRALKARKRMFSTTCSQKSTNSTNSKIINSVQRRVTYVLLINGVIFFLCQVLNRSRNILNILIYFEIVGQRNDNSSEFLYLGDDNLFPIIGGILVLLQSAVNPLIYTFGSSLYRDSLLEAFGCKTEQKQQSTGAGSGGSQETRNVDSMMASNI